MTLLELSFLITFIDNFLRSFLKRLVQGWIQFAMKGGTQNFLLILTFYWERLT